MRDETEFLRVDRTPKCELFGLIRMDNAGAILRRNGRNHLDDLLTRVSTLKRIINAAEVLEDEPMRPLAFRRAPPANRTS